MDTTTKTQICERLSIFCAQKGSQNKAANALNGVSSATISKVLNNDWELINGNMWRNIASQVGYRKKVWNTVETMNYKLVQMILKDAQENALVFAITGAAGSGKSLAAKGYEDNNSEVYVLSCNEYWNRKMFLMSLARSMGREVAGLTVGDMMAEIIKDLKIKDFPLIVFDEADKLSDQVLYFFITLYNQLEDHCGIVLLATDHLEKKIRKGVRNNTKGYSEIFSRIGRKFIKMVSTPDADVKEICTANGISDMVARKKILAEYEGDLRRVRRMCFAASKNE